MTNEQYASQAEFVKGIHYDRSLLRHFKSPINGHLNDALANAIIIYGRLQLAPTWFWFNGTPAPIVPDDTPITLGARWWEWRAAHHAGTLLSKMEKWALGQ